MSDIPVIRRARPDEADPLSALAFRSKAYWGYDAAFMEQCRDELTLSSARIENGLVYVADLCGKVVGFYALDHRGLEADVDFLFITPDRIGAGLGRLLWRHMAATAQALGAERLVVESDPDAEPFYRAMGCVRIGEAPSASIPGRTLPLLHFDLLH